MSTCNYFSLDPAEIKKPPDSVFSLKVGLSTSVNCDASGFPPPRLEWIRGSGGPTTVRRNNSAAVLELNSVSEEDEGYYYCVAENTLVNPPKGRRYEADTWKITVMVEGTKMTILSHERSMQSFFE